MSIYLLNFVMSILSLAAGTEPQHNNTAEPEAMPNIGYLFRGYDLMYGNPLPTDGFFDPGFVSQSLHLCTPWAASLPTSGTSNLMGRPSHLVKARAR